MHDVNCPSATSRPKTLDLVPGDRGFDPPGFGRDDIHEWFTTLLIATALHAGARGSVPGTEPRPEGVTVLSRDGFRRQSCIEHLQELVIGKQGFGLERTFFHCHHDA